MSKKNQSVTKAAREERISREQLRRQGDILAVARDVLSSEGIGGFSMERVAEEAGYSRTAIYRYFPSKEELVIALAIETSELRLELYERVGDFDALSRERLVALGEVTSILYPRHARAEVVAFANALRVKTSKERQNRLRALERRDHEVVLELAREAVAGGDFVVPAGLTLEEVIFAIGGLTRAIFNPLSTTTSPEELGIGDLRMVLRRIGSQYLDGLGWRPLSSEWDYRETMRRIYREVFPSSYLASLGLAEDPPLALREKTPSRSSR